MENIKCFEYAGWDKKGKFLFEIAAEDFDVGGSFEVDGQYYTAHSFSPLEKEAYISEITIKSSEELEDWWNEILTYAEEEITCPYCHSTFECSWEYPEQEDNELCETCGGTFSYQQEVTVTYSSQPVSPPNPIKYEAK
jgi:Uncharacterized protein conserved in bacteria